VVRGQLDLGGASPADVLAQEATRTETQATLPPLEKQLAQQRNQLMRLVGRSPDQQRGESFDLAKLKLPEELPLSLPSSLVEQRPDVRAAEAQLHAASADIGVAVANQMPQFTITGALGLPPRGRLVLLVPGRASGHRARHRPDVLDGANSPSAQGAIALQAAAALYGHRAVGLQDVANALRAFWADADALRTGSGEQTAPPGSAGGRSSSARQLPATNQGGRPTRRRSSAACGAGRYADTAAVQALGGGWWNRGDVGQIHGQARLFALPPVRDIKLPDPVIERAGYLTSRSSVPEARAMIKRCS
jgi:hypothetical protein